MADTKTIHIQVKGVPDFDVAIPNSATYADVARHVETRTGIPADTQSMRRERVVIGDRGSIPSDGETVTVVRTSIAGKDPDGVSVRIHNGGSELGGEGTGATIVFAIDPNTTVRGLLDVLRMPTYGCRVITVNGVHVLADNEVLVPHYGAMEAVHVYVVPATVCTYVPVRISHGPHDLTIAADVYGPISELRETATRKFGLSNPGALEMRVVYLSGHTASYVLGGAGMSTVFEAWTHRSDRGIYVVARFELLDPVPAPSPVSSTFTVHVKKLGADTQRRAVQVRPTDTMADLERNVADFVGIPPGRQIIARGGCTFLDRDTMAEAGIKPGDSLDVLDVSIAASARVLLGQISDSVGMFGPLSGMARGCDADLRKFVIGGLGGSATAKYGASRPLLVIKRQDAAAIGRKIGTFMYVREDSGEPIRDDGMTLDELKIVRGTRLRRVDVPAVPKILMTIRRTSGDAITMHVHPRAGVAHTMIKIRDKTGGRTGVKPRCQKLSFGGRPLERGKTLDEYGITEGGVVDLEVLPN